MGANKAQKDSAINKIINTVILVVLIVMLLCIAVAAVFAFNFSRALKKGINMVQSVSSGNLKNEMDTKLIKGRMNSETYQRRSAACRRK